MYLIIDDFPNISEEILNSLNYPFDKSFDQYPKILDVSIPHLDNTSLKKLKTIVIDSLIIKNKLLSNVSFNIDMVMCEEFIERYGGSISKRNPSTQYNELLIAQLITVMELEIQEFYNLKNINTEIGYLISNDGMDLNILKIWDPILNSYKLDPSQKSIFYLGLLNTWPLISIGPKIKNLVDFTNVTGPLKYPELNFISDFIQNDNSMDIFASPLWHSKKCLDDFDDFMRTSFNFDRYSLIRASFINPCKFERSVDGFKADLINNKLVDSKVLHDIDLGEYRPSSNQKFNLMSTLFYVSIKPQVSRRICRY